MVIPPVVVNRCNPHYLWPNLLAPVLSGTHFLTSKRWKVELAQQWEEIWRSNRMTSKGNLTLGGSHGSTTVYPLMVDIKFVKIHWLWNDLAEQKTNFENWLCQSISWLFLNFYYLNVNSQLLYLSFTFFSSQWSPMIRVLDYQSKGLVFKTTK